VTVLRREADGSLKGIRTVTTDTAGQVSVDLPELGNDTVYALRTAMKHGNRTVTSMDITQAGQFTFKVGNVRVKAINGQNNTILAEYRINAYTRMADGTDIYLSNSGTNTDGLGLADFDLPALGNGQVYVFKAQSTFDNTWRTSALVSQKGQIDFVVGNQLLNVTVTDGIGNTSLANQPVTVLRRETDGSLKWASVGNTDSSGQLSLDLPGLGSDTIYALRTAMKHGNRTATSIDITRTGSFAFKAGNVRVQAINGQTGAVLGAQQINVYSKQADGSEAYFSNTTSDDNGLADFDLPNVTNGQSYVFKAQNRFDGIWKTSAPISQAGLTKFVVGNQLLHVTVTDGIGNTPLANQAVTVLRREADGSLKGINAVTTDAEGLLSLDLPGLASDTVYVLRTQQLFGSGTVFSSEINHTGNFDFKVGNLLVSVFDGANDQPIVGQDVTVMEEWVDGSLLWFARVPTDQNGQLPLHLPKLGQGGKYVLRAQTKLDARWITSPLIVNPGKSDFKVGNKLLNVQVQDALAGTALANVEVVAYERLPDQTLRGFQRKSTNAQGLVDFDLTGLGLGSTYVLKTNPYGTWLESPNLEKTGPFQMVAGGIAVKLFKAKTGEVLPAQSLAIYEKSPTGGLIWRKTLVTDASGIARFDPPGLGDGRRFVIIANNVFANGKNHFSRWISAKGWVDFAVDAEDPNKLDIDPPVIVSFLPTNNAQLASQGFQAQLKVTDNQKVDKVELTIIDPVAGTFTGPAKLVKGQWIFTVTSNMLTVGKWVTVKAVAYDKVGNQAGLTRQYRIIQDTTSPQLSVTSHQSGDQIDEHGFALLGSVIDNTVVKTLRATVSDPDRGVIINDRELEVGLSGHWGLAVSQLSRGKTVTIDLSAEDWAGNYTQKQLQLPVMTEAVSAVQLLNRITFGASPELLKEVRTLGTEAFIQQQLQPSLINDSEFESYLAGVLNQEPNDVIKLQHAQIARAGYSKKQLLEVMTWFWENHFNTDRSKTGNDFELAENNAFRAHALGRFRDLLEVSAKSPAMLLYLDNHLSRKLAPNENYARELMELHTLGVDNGYTAHDIAEVARVFTGWRVANRQFEFAPWAHDNAEKSVLGHTIPAGSGVAGGEQVLDLLAAHQGTARHICSKLLKLLLSDQPSEESVVSCANDFVNHADEDNQIARVLEGILRSSAFSDSAQFHNKVKNPLEFTSALFRQLPVTVHYGYTNSLLKGMDMHLYFFADPTGWPEQADSWVSSDQLTQRWQFAGKTLFNKPSTWGNYWAEPAQFFINNDIETSEGVLAFLFELTLSHDYSAMEFAAAKALLTSNDSEYFDIHAADAHDKLRKVIGLIVNFPAYQLQ